VRYSHHSFNYNEKNVNALGVSGNCLGGGEVEPVAECQRGISSQSEVSLSGRSLWHDRRNGCVTHESIEGRDVCGQRVAPALQVPIDAG
jgi:hypothetical protein